jgi:hypothetical protein
LFGVLAVELVGVVQSEDRVVKAQDNRMVSVARTS